MKTRRTMAAVLGIAMAGGGGYCALRGDDSRGTSLEVSEPQPLAAPADRIEREALARFRGSKPIVRLADGSEAPPSNEVHAKAIVVNAYKTLLVREEEERDPLFRIRAEEELERRRPLHASIRWEDDSGTREMVFLVEDTRQCDLVEEDSELELSPNTLRAHPCLVRDGIARGDVALTVTVNPVKASEPLWSELLQGIMREEATRAHLAREEAEGEPI